MIRYASALVLVSLGATYGAPAMAAKRVVTVTVQNLVPANSVTITPLRLGFNNGTFDAFNEGGTPTAPIISIAEGGTGADWFPAFAAADPTAVLGSVGGGPATPGSGPFSAKFTIDTDVNPFFTFGAMVVPSNDFFIGNDDPMEYRLFDAAGNLLIGAIDQRASDIWNAGSEAFDPAKAAFLVGGVNALRTPENGVTEFNFTELARFDGLTTAAGFVFTSRLGADTPVYRISFSAAAVPEPTAWATMVAGFGLIGGTMRSVGRKRQTLLS